MLERYSIQMLQENFYFYVPSTYSMFYYVKSADKMFFFFLCHILIWSLILEPLV